MQRRRVEAYVSQIAESISRRFCLSQIVECTIHAAIKFVAVANPFACIKNNAQMNRSQVNDKTFSQFDYAAHIGYDRIDEQYQIE